MIENNIFYIGVGRCKRATATLFLKEGTGNFKINRKNSKKKSSGMLINDYFYMNSFLCDEIFLPLKIFNKEKNFDFKVRVKGGGFSSQSLAIRLALSSAILKIFPEYRSTLKSFSLLNKNIKKKKERKKIGLKKARKAPQFSKR